MTIAFVGAGAQVSATDACSNASIPAGSVDDSLWYPVLWRVKDGQTSADRPQGPDDPENDPDSLWIHAGTAHGVIDGEVFGLDAGPVSVTTFFRVATNTEGSTAPDATLPGAHANSVVGGCVIRLSKTLAYWDNPTMAWGEDDTKADAFSAALDTDLGFTTSDWGLLVAGLIPDTINVGLSLTGAGSTYTTTSRSSGTMTAGHDARLNVRTVTVSGGSSSGAPTASSATTGGGGVVQLFRVRETNTPPAPFVVAGIDGADLTGVEAGTNIVLDGHQSFARAPATIDDVEWKDQDDNVVGTTLIATVVAPPSLDGEAFTYTLTVTDSEGATASDDMDVTVLAAPWRVLNTDNEWVPCSLHQDSP